MQVISAVLILSACRVPPAHTRAQLGKNSALIVLVTGLLLRVVAQVCQHVSVTLGFPELTAQDVRRVRTRTYSVRIRACSVKQESTLQSSAAPAKVCAHVARNTRGPGLEHRV